MRRAGGDVESARPVEDAAAGEVRRHHQLRPRVHRATTRSRATTTATRSGTSRTRASPTLKTAYFCPASQSDVSVYKNLLFVSGEGLTGRLDCGARGREGHGQQGSPARPSHLRHQRHREPEVRRQRADVPRIAHAHAARRSEGPGQRLRLHLRLVARALAERACRLRRARCRTRIPTRRSSASK